MRGIEINEYAHELASVTVWIGYIQWMRENGFNNQRNPVLRKIENITHMDALMRVEADGSLSEPDWPSADVIIGNPPFLGDKKMRAELGDEYVDRLRRLYEGSIPGGADLVTYWFARSHAMILAGQAKRSGLLATNGIRFGANRHVLDRIKADGDIFMAWRDRPWILDGAAVRVSMVGFDNGSEQIKMLDGMTTDVINADLTGSLDVTSAVPLSENAELCFLGMMKSGPFDLDAATAHAMLIAPPNPNGRPNTDVMKPRIGGQDITGRPRKGWVIDFGVDMTEERAALYEKPFEYVKRVIQPKRATNHVAGQRDRWWLFARPRPGLRAAMAGLPRAIATPEVAKHRLFAWIDATSVPDHTLHVIARADDYAFGILHSKTHEIWSLAQCNFMGVGNDPRYTSTRTFATFPFPWPPGCEPAGDDRVEAISAAARELVALRDAWLNPSMTAEVDLRERTLTNLYNERPTWLANAHRKLDRAVFAAYGWPDDLPDSEILARLLALNRERAGQMAGLQTYPSSKPDSPPETGRG
jgi:type II restriction/modification system DNA methylase subunit YeeA